MRPNVLLVVLDAARLDALEPYGARVGSSPAVAQLASRGAAFPDVHATGSWTTPSHASMFTGLMPRAAGLAQAVSPPAAKPIVESHRDRLLPEVMRRAGYRTMGASANLWVSSMSGFDTGFDDFFASANDREANIHLRSRRDKLRLLTEAARGRVDDGAGQIADVVASWPGKAGDGPFFGFVNVIECHSPYLPPRGYGSVGVRDRVLAANDASRYYTLEEIWRVCCGAKQIPEATLERMRRLYAGAIRYMDDWLARVLERIDARGALDDTLVIVASDHGENFGENGLITHGLSLDQRLIHVPFVVAGPGADGPPLTSLADLPRWIAERAGLAEHPWNDGPPAGFGLAQFDPPAEAGDEKVRRALEESGLGHAIDFFTTPLTAAVAGSLKLLRRGNEEVVYDLAADPLEEKPLAAGDDALTARRHEVAALRAAIEHPSMTARAGGEAHPAGAPATSEAELRDLEDRMRLLGYM